MMMRRRAGRPGLIGTMATTAVIAGTATAVSGGVSRRQQQRSEAAYRGQEADQAAFESQVELADLKRQMAEAQAAPAAAPADDLTTKLSKLSELRTSGVLTEEEFAAAKLKLLA